MIRLADVHKKLGGKQVLDGLSLEVERGETMVVIGRSGSGKSVTFKHITGLMRPDRGQVLVDGTDVATARNHELHTVRRRLRMLFQAGALVNCADQPADCDFFLPAVVGEGEVVVAIGTGGSAPALAVGLKGPVASALPERVGEFAAALGELRECVKADVADSTRRGEILRTLAGQVGYDAFCAGGSDALAKLLDEMT